MSDTIDLTPIKVSGPQDDSIDLTPKNSPLPPKESADAINLVKKLSPNPDEAQKKLDLAKNLSPSTGMSEWFIFKNAEAVSAKLYGNPSENPGSASSKLDATIKDVPLNQQINARWAQQMREGETPEGQQEIKELQAKRVSNGKGVWSFIVNAASGMVIQGQSLLRASVPPPIGGGKDAMDAYYQTQLKNSDELVGSMTGEMYGSLREQGVSAKSAKAASGVMIAAQVALNTLSVSKVPGVGRALEDLGKAGAKALASGQIAKAIGVQVGKGYAEQGAVAIVNNATAVIIPEFARLLDDDVKKGNISQPDAAEILKQFGEGVLMQTLVMGTVSAGLGAAGAARAARSKFAEESAKIAAEADKLPAEAPSGAKAASSGKEGEVPSMRLAEEAKAKAAEAKAEASRVALAKQAVAATPAAELDKPIVPRGTQAPITGKESFGKTPAERINDLATLEKNKVITEPQQAELDKLRADQAKTPAIMDVVAKDRSVRGIRQLLEGDPTNPSLNEALKFAEDQAAKDALEKQAVVNERVRVETVASRNKLIDTIHSIDWAKMNKDLGDAVKAIQDKFEPRGHTLKADMGDQKVAELAGVHDALQAAGNDVSPELDLARLKDLPTTKLRDLTVQDIKVILDAVLNLDHINRMRGKVRNAAKAVEMSHLEKHPISRPHPNNPAWERTFRDVRSREHSITKSYDYLTEWISGGKNNDLHDIIGRNVVEGYVDSKAKAVEYTDPFYAMMKEKHGIDELDNNIGWVKYWNETFEEDGVKMTREEILHDYMNFQNENNRTSLLSPEGGEVIPSHKDEFGNNPGVEHISEETYQKLFAHVESDKDLTEIAKKQMEIQGNDRDKYHQDEHGFPMPREDNYWPKYNVDVGQLDIKGIEEGKRFIPIAPSESRQKARTGYHGPLYNYGFTHTLKQSANESALITQMGPAARAAGAVLNNPVIKKSIIDAVGETTHRGMIKDLETMVGRHDTPSDLEHALNSFGNVVSTVALGSLNTVKAPIKIGSLGLRSLARHPEVALETLRDIVSNYKTTSAEAYTISKRLQVAKRHGGTLDLKQMLANEGNVGSSTVVKAGLANVKRKTSALVRKASNFSYVMDTAVAANAVDHEFKRITDADSRASRAEKLSAANPDDQKIKAQAEALRKKSDATKISDDIASASHLTKEEIIKGITPEQRSAAQGRYADQLIGETHATGDAPNMVGMQKSAVGRNIIGKFHVEPYKAGEVLSRAFMQMKRNPSAKNINTAVRLVVYYGLAEGAFIYGIDAAYNGLMNAVFGTKGTKKQQEKKAPKLGEEIIRDDIAKVPIAGEIAQSAIDTAKYHTAQAGAVESYAQLPLNTVMGIITLMDSRSTQKQRNTATQHVMYGVGHALGIGILSDIYQRLHQ